jgi:hypothetical protein
MATVEHPHPGLDSTSTPLAIEIASYRALLPELLEHEGDFVLIKDRDVIGFYPERRLAQRAGYERFGVEPFLVKRIERTEPAVLIPNVQP